MWKKIAVAGAVAAGIVGAGTAAMAETGSSSAPAAPATSSSANGATTGTAARPHVRHPLFRAMGKNFEHGEWVTSKNGQNVTHAAIKGTVSAVTATSITVRASDGTSWSFTVDAQTKVFERENGKGSGTRGAIADVQHNDRVVVAGTVSGSTRTAAHVLDTGTR